MNELIDTMALEALPMFLRQAKKKHLLYDCLDETAFTTCRLQIRLFKGKVGVIFTEMDKGVMASWYKRVGEIYPTARRCL